MPGCAAMLWECARRQILLGIASNAQAYTLSELQLALQQVGLDPVIFAPT